MATWIETRIEWLGPPPDARHLHALNQAMQALDYDAPTLTEKGLEANWRSPHWDYYPHGFGTLLEILTRAGFPVRGATSRVSTSYCGGFPQPAWVNALPPTPEYLAALEECPEWHEFMAAYLRALR